MLFELSWFKRVFCKSWQALVICFGFKSLILADLFLFLNLKKTRMNMLSSPMLAAKAVLNCLDMLSDAK